jgi:ankyrin repeat protein
LLSRINLQDDGRTPLHEAVINGDAATVEALIVAGGPNLIDIRDAVGCTMK